jgi:hypothetical protein
MTYAEALEAIIRGKKVARKAWKKENEGETFVFLANNIRIGNFCVEDLEVTPCMCLKTSIPSVEMGWKPEPEDKSAKDWEEIE